MPREDRERRYVADYLARYHPREVTVTNVPLGPIPGEIVARFGLAAGSALYRPSRPRVDAVVVQPRHYWLVEAKIREPRDAIGALLVYLELARTTTDLPEYDGQELRGRLVVPWVLDWVRALARAHDLDLVEYLPPWVEGYVRERQNYFTREYRVARDERMRLRRSLGVD